MIKPNKVLIIGIDGGTWRTLKPAMDKGNMPFLKNQVENGASGILESTMPANTPSAWGGFQTGMNPGKFDVFSFAAWDKNKDKMQLVNSNYLPRTIWEVISDAGKRVGVVNVPMTYPPKPINGYMITGILTPSLNSNFTYPPELKFELLKVVPQYHILNLENIQKDSLHKQFKPFIHQMIDILENRSKAAQFIIEKEPLDIFMVNFQAIDVIQHTMWCYLDETHPLYDQNKQNYIFEHFFNYLDKKIKDVYESFSQMIHSEFLTLIISDHGFQTHKKRFNLGNWLYQEGFLTLNLKVLQKPWSSKLIRKLTRILQKLRFKAANVPQKTRKDPLYLEPSRAFAVWKSLDGYIYLLEKEQSKQEETATELIEKLSAVKDPEDGIPIIQNIYRKEEIFSGKYPDLMPDLLIEPTDGYSITGSYQTNANLFHKVNIKEDFHIGKHHKDGILVAVGKNVKKQENIRTQIIDITPTILYYMRLPTPRNVDGRALKEFFLKNS